MPQGGSSVVYTVPITSLCPATFSALVCTAHDLLTFESDKHACIGPWRSHAGLWVLLALSSIRHNCIRVQNPFLNLISFTGFACPITNIVSRLIWCHFYSGSK